MHKYDDMPQANVVGEFIEDDEAAGLVEWQKAHEPTLRLCVWLSTDGRAIVNGEWAASIAEASLTEKPLLDMQIAVVYLVKALAKITDNITILNDLLNKMEDVGRAN